MRVEEPHAAPTLSRHTRSEARTTAWSPWQGVRTNGEQVDFVPVQYCTLLKDWKLLMYTGSLHSSAAAPALSAREDGCVLQQLFQHSDAGGDAGLPAMRRRLHPRPALPSSRSQPLVRLATLGGPWLCRDTAHRSARTRGGGGMVGGLRRARPRPHRCTHPAPPERAERRRCRDAHARGVFPPLTRPISPHMCPHMSHPMFPKYVTGISCREMR